MFPLERTALLEVIRHSHGHRFVLHAVVVMDDHVHTLVTPDESNALESIIRNWKACGAARLRGTRCGPFWQRGYFDTIIRSASEFITKLRYIELNPYRRWPGCGSYAWLWVRGNQ